MEDMEHMEHMNGAHEWSTWSIWSIWLEHMEGALNNGWRKQYGWSIELCMELAIYLSYR